MLLPKYYRNLEFSRRAKIEPSAQAPARQRHSHGPDFRYTLPASRLSASADLSFNRLAVFLALRRLVAGQSGLLRASNLPETRFTQFPRGWRTRRRVSRHARVTARPNPPLRRRGPFWAAAALANGPLTYPVEAGKTESGLMRRKIMCGNRRSPLRCDHQPSSSCREKCQVDLSPYTVSN